MVDQPCHSHRTVLRDPAGNNKTSICCSSPQFVARQFRTLPMADFRPTVKQLLLFMAHWPLFRIRLKLCQTKGNALSWTMMPAIDLVFNCTIDRPFHHDVAVPAILYRILPKSMTSTSRLLLCRHEQRRGIRSEEQRKGIDGPAPDWQKRGGRKDTRMTSITTLANRRLFEHVYGDHPSAREPEEDIYMHG